MARPIPNVNIPADEVMRLFDALPDVVFFIKNREGIYMYVNQTLVRRLGKHNRQDVVGCSPESLFPHPLGANYHSQDMAVLSGTVIQNQLELHLFPNRMPGWCLTYKYPLLEAGEAMGVIGASRDLSRLTKNHQTYERLAKVVNYMEANYMANLQVGALAQLAQLSIAQLERHFQHIFQLSPHQMLTKMRIDAAIHSLRGPKSIANIASSCGYDDQSAFSRQFRKVTGLTPGQYRKLSAVS